MTNIYVLEGKDRFLLQQNVKKIMQQHHLVSDEVHTYDLTEHTLEEALEDLDTYSLLTPQKCIILENPSFLRSDGGKLADKTEKHFDKYLQNPAKEVTLIIKLEKADERKKLTKQLKKLAVWNKIEENSTSLLKSYLGEYKLEKEAQEELLDRCQNDFGKLYQELEKLKLYVLPKKTITKKQVVDLVSRKLNDSEQTVFTLVHFIITQNKKEALLVYQDLLELKIEPLGILALIANQFHLLLQVKVLENENYRKNEIAKMLAVHPYRVEKAREVTHDYQIEQLANYIKALASLDFDIKQGKIEAKVAIELFILKL